MLDTLCHSHNTSYEQFSLLVVSGLYSSLRRSAPFVKHLLLTGGLTKRITGKSLFLIYSPFSLQQTS